MQELPAHPSLSGSQDFNKGNDQGKGQVKARTIAGKVPDRIEDATMLDPAVTEGHAGSHRSAMKNRGARQGGP
jgi:hypothetical protein